MRLCDNVFLSLCQSELYSDCFRFYQKYVHNHFHQLTLFLFPFELKYCLYKLESHHESFQCQKTRSDER